MIVKIYRIPFGFFHNKDEDFKIWEQGYAKVPKFNKDELWDMCNWKCYTNIKPSNLFSDIEVANSDVIFHNPRNKKYYIALPFGWKIVDSFEKIEQACNLIRRENIKK